MKLNLEAKIYLILVGLGITQQLIGAFTDYWWSTPLQFQGMGMTLGITLFTSMKSLLIDILEQE